MYIRRNLCKHCIAPRELTDSTISLTTQLVRLLFSTPVPMRISRAVAEDTFRLRLLIAYCLLLCHCIEATFVFISCNMTD